MPIEAAVCRCFSEHSSMFQVDVLKNFAIFTGKHLWWSLFSIKLQATPPNVLKVFTLLKELGPFFFTLPSEAVARRCFTKSVFLKCFQIFTGKRLRPLMKLKTDLGTGVFVWILLNFSEYEILHFIMLAKSYDRLKRGLLTKRYNITNVTQEEQHLSKILF